MFIRAALTAVFVIGNAIHIELAQEERSGSVRLLRLDGSFSSELPTRIDSPDSSEIDGFRVIEARLENDGMGALSRIRSRLTVVNTGQKRRITAVDWLLSIYDEASGSQSQRVVQTAKLNIYPGDQATATESFGAVLPDRMIILLQVVRVSFDEGTAWLAPVNCSVGEDLRTVSCKSQ